MMPSAAFLVSDIVFPNKLLILAFSKKVVD
jgi:hypothetical protein